MSHESSNPSHLQRPHPQLLSQPASNPAEADTAVLPSATRPAGRPDQRLLQRVWSLMIAGGSALLLAGCSGSQAESSIASATSPEVPVQRVTEQWLPDRFEFTGHTAPAHQVDVRARVGGYLIHVPYTEGQFVKAGTLLFEIDPRPFEAELARTQAEVARAKAAVNLARQELERAEQLAEKDAIAMEELERRRTEMETAGATLAAAVAQKEAAALDVEFTRVKTPVSGRVGRALVKSGNLISGGDANGTLLTTLVTVDPLHVMFTVDEPAHRRLFALRSAGETIHAEVKLGDDAGTVHGTLDYLAPALDARSGTGQARLVVDNAEGHLTPGLFARITVIAKSGHPRVLVPEKAVGALQGSRYVLVVGDDNALVHRPVLLGERRGSERVVLQGLSAGESIVVNGLQRVRPGMTVQPVEVALASK